MTNRDAVHHLVAYVEQAPARDEIAQAVRLVLQELKAQTQAADRLGKALDGLLAATAPQARPQELLASPAQTPSHPHLGGKA